MPVTVSAFRNSYRFTSYVILLGLFFTFRGYRSREVDQAYRIPILLHQQDAQLFAGDPFVTSFAAFNPHRGFLALMDGGSRLVGLSATLAVLFALTFFATVAGLDRLGSAVWSDRDRDRRTGLIAAALALIALAGNIGTNHLFESMLLDRLIGFGLGWMALALAAEAGHRSSEWSAAAVGLAALVHPSVGLQLAMLLGISRLFWWLLISRGGRNG